MVNIILLIPEPSPYTGGSPSDRQMQMRETRLNERDEDETTLKRTVQTKTEDETQTKEVIQTNGANTLLRERVRTETIMIDQENVTADRTEFYYDQMSLTEQDTQHNRNLQIQRSQMWPQPQNQQAAPLFHDDMDPAQPDLSPCKNFQSTLQRKIHYRYITPLEGNA